MKTKVVVSNQTNPYWNLAVENYLLSLPDTDTAVFYLWKNRRTVVIGQNQNPYTECNVENLLNEDGFLLRRTTGGGAVYHDDGNLNFSFVMPYGIYDQARQFEVIAKALSSFGLTIETSGRNDLLCEGRKFSGNAFSKAKHQRLHHGTILIKSNIEDLSRYLKAKPAKLHKHGVASVKSRVVNLSEIADITSENIVEPLIRAFEEVYGSSAERVSFEELLSLPPVIELYNKYRSNLWLFGKWEKFKTKKSAQFDWGEVAIDLTIDEAKGTITDIEIATDSLDVHLSESVKTLLCGASIQQRPTIPTEAADNAPLNNIVSLIFD